MPPKPNLIVNIGASTAILNRKPKPLPGQSSRVNTRSDFPAIPAVTIVDELNLDEASDDMGMILVSGTPTVHQSERPAETQPTMYKDLLKRQFAAQLPGALHEELSVSGEVSVIKLDLLRRIVLLKDEFTSLTEEINASLEKPEMQSLGLQIACLENKLSRANLDKKTLVDEIHGFNSFSHTSPRSSSPANRMFNPIPLPMQQLTVTSRECENELEKLIHWYTNSQSPSVNRFFQPATTTLTPPPVSNKCLLTCTIL